MTVIHAWLSTSGTLHAAAAAAEGARPVAGRGTAYAVETTDGHWLVRHYRRGGMFAPLLADRYFRWGSGRALHELRVSAQARAAGVPTPEVIAAAAYPAGAFARHDIIVAWIAGAADLASVLFEQPDHDAATAVQHAASLIRTVCAAGLKHPDLNLKNILIGPGGGYVIDLDRCRLSRSGRARNAESMRRRFTRSLEKWEARTGRQVPARQRGQLIEAFRVA